MQEQEKDNPGVIAPPPLIYLAGLAIGFALDRFWPLDFDHYLPAGIVLELSRSLLK
jgi:hypothetical protein